MRPIGCRINRMRSNASWGPTSSPLPRRRNGKSGGKPELTSRFATASGRTAADAYLPETAHDNGGQRPHVGILSLVVRERNPGPAAPSVGSRRGTAGRGGRARTAANLPYLTGLFILAFALALIRGVLMNALTYLAAAVTLDFVTRLAAQRLPSHLPARIAGSADRRARRGR